MSNPIRQDETKAVTAAPAPMSYLDDMLAPSRPGQEIENKKQQEDALEKVLKNLLGQVGETPKFSTSVIDAMVAEIDRKLSAQVDEIIHAPAYQAMESAWKGLKYLVDGTNFAEKIEILFLDVTKQELIDDFENAPIFRQTKMVQTVIQDAYGVLGGKPYGAIIANYAFGPTQPDVSLLRQLSNVAAQAHAPFIAGADPNFWDMDSFEGLDRKGTVSLEHLTRWQSFRNSENANYVGLVLPRFMLRLPYDPVQNPAKAFTYEENVSKSHEHYLWGNASFALAAKMHDSFASDRWCANMIGAKSGGTVDQLPVHQYQSMGALATKPPTEVIIPDDRELALAKEGFIPLVWRKGTDKAVFFSASSTQKEKNFIGDKNATTNFKLGTRLPYLFLVTRLAHYIKVTQREELGGSKDRATMEKELNDLMRPWISGNPNPDAKTMAERPFKAVSITVSDIEGEPGWYQVGMKVKPHFKFEGANFELSLVGTIEPNK